MHRRPGRRAGDVPTDVGTLGPGCRRPARGGCATWRSCCQPPRQRPRVVPRILGDADGRRGGRSRQHPLLRERGDLRRHRCRCRSGPAPRRATARRRAVRHGRRRAQDPCGIDVHQRDDRLSEGCDGHPRELPVEQRDLCSDHAHPGRRSCAQLDFGPAFPRHRMQQPTSAHPPTRRNGGDHARVRRAGLPASHGRRAHKTCSRRCPRSSGWR